MSPASTDSNERPEPALPDAAGVREERIQRARGDRDPEELLAREQALRQQAEAARASLRAIFESVPGSYLVLAPDDDYRIVGVTEAYLRSTMTERAAIVDQPLFDVFPEDPNEPETDGRPAAIASLARVRRTLKADVMGVHRFPIRRPAEQGGGYEERYWSSINAPVRGPTGELAYIIHRVEDVTAFVQQSEQNDAAYAVAGSADSTPLQMQAEIVQRTQDLQAANQRLRESEARYRELIQSLPAAVYTCDAEGRISLYNQVAVDLWGCEPDAGKTLSCGSWRIYRPDGSPLRFDECPLAAAIREGRQVRGEIAIERPDGRRLNVLATATPTFDAEGSVTGAVNLLLDITEQTRAEEARAHLAAIVDSSDDAIISKDLEGVIRSWNIGAERIFGYSEQEMIGQKIARIIPPELRDEERRILEKIRRGARVEHFEAIRVTRDGRQLDVSLSISPIHNATGAVVGASKIARDITESKRIARLAAEADRRKDQFLAMLAHELRNPLAAITSAVELLGLPGGPESLDSTRRMIGRQTAHLVHLVEDLMDMSRISRGMVTLRKAAIDARTVVERAIETVKPLMDEQRHRLQASVPDAPLTVEGDMIRLEQLVVNLLTNAAKFTKPGGLVRVEVEKRGDDIRISVRDNGTGISRELLPHVFDLFSQSERSADRSAGGLGIGLTLVKAIAEMHGGSAEGRSAGTGRGSEFIVRLPALSRAAVEEPVPPELEAGEDSVTAQRVLVVDDNEDAAMGLARLLELSGHEVRQAHSGPAALEEASAFKPDAILLDIGLPDLDGYEVAKRLRQDAELPDVTLIAISGYCQPADRRRSREAGFDHHLAKPTDHRRLLRLLERTGTRDGREDGGRRNA